MNKVVTAVEESRNSKTGIVSATYAPMQSCPKTCKFLDKGCYAQSGHCGFTARRITENVPRKKGPVYIAEAEAKEISKLTGKYPLRLHVVGDCRTPQAAEIVANAAFKYSLKEDQPVWTYTHAWRDVPRASWGNVSVLASCETFEEVQEANGKGYATCMIRYAPFEKRFKWNGFTMQPCLEMTTGKQCKDCKLCFNDKLLRGHKTIICFFPHGSRKNLVTEILKLN